MKFRGKFFYNRTWFTPGWAEIIILLLMLLVGAILGTIILIPFAGKMPAEYTELIAYPIMFIPPILYARAKSRRNCMWDEPKTIDHNNFGKPGWILCAIAAMAGTLALAFSTDPVTGLLPPMPDFLKNAMKSLTQGNLWVNLLCVSIMAPVMEEWLCRGTILRGLLSHGVKPWWAITASALIFALIHANPWQAVPAFTLGLLFGYVYFRTGSLKLTVLMHFTNNTFSLIMSRIPGFSEMESWTDVMGRPQYLTILTACIAVTVLVVLVFRKIEPVKH